MGQYFCIILGTGAVATSRIAAVSGIAASWGKSVTTNSNYICVIVGTGPEATDQAIALQRLADTWGVGDQTCTGDSPCC